MIVTNCLSYLLSQDLRLRRVVCSVMIWQHCSLYLLSVALRIQDGGDHVTKCDTSQPLGALSEAYNLLRLTSSISKVDDEQRFLIAWGEDKWDRLAGSVGKVLETVTCCQSVLFLHIGLLFHLVPSCLFVFRYFTILSLPNMTDRNR